MHALSRTLKNQANRDVGIYGDSCQQSPAIFAKTSTKRNPIVTNHKNVSSHALKKPSNLTQMYTIHVQCSHSIQRQIKAMNLNPMDNPSSVINQIPRSRMPINEVSSLASNPLRCITSLDLQSDESNCIVIKQTSHIAHYATMQ